MGGNAMRKVLTVVSCLLVVAVMLSGTAYAEWMFAQGNVGEIEYPANCTYKNFGWGLDITQKSGNWNWIHLPVPTKAGGTWGARYIRLKFYTGSADATVTEIHVYNGNTKVKTFLGLNISNGYKDLQFDLGSKMKFNRGMGISFRIGAGVESLMSHRFMFHAAGANFYEDPSVLKKVE
jgi:hypothetical protein